MRQTHHETIKATSAHSVVHRASEDIFRTYTHIPRTINVHTYDRILVSSS